MIKGKIHSIQSFGAVDGPGLRSVIFFQGCPLRCAYCHNPDTWDINRGEDVTVNEVLDKVKRFYPYIKNGGVTLSGGECLLQPEFATELLRGFKGMGLHTAIDTSGICNLEKAISVLKETDLVICDIKFDTDGGYQKYAGGSLERIKQFLRLTEEMNIPLWIRHVVVPGITDSEVRVKEVISIAEKYGNLEKIELLPFRKICLPKYENMGIEFPLKDTPECSAEVVESLKKLIKDQYR
jgi:pyruvate formate lyase activating enzyme